MSGIPKTRQGRMLTVAAASFAVWQSAVLIHVLNHEHSGTWFQLWRDAGLNIFGIPWWVLAGAAVALVVVAAIAFPELIPFLPDLLPEIGEAAAEGIGGAAAEGAEIGAEAIDIGTEGAIEEEIAAAQNRLEAELASKVNPLGGTDNCAWAAREVDQGLADMLAGRTPEPYAPEWPEPGMSDGSVMPSGESAAPWEADMTTNQALEQEYGSFFQESSMQRIAEQLDAAGNGARGIVRVAGDSGVGHVFNAVNYGGEVFFVDGQTGAVWTSAEQLPGAWGAGNPNIWFLPTAG